MTAKGAGRGRKAPTGLDGLKLLEFQIMDAQGAVTDAIRTARELRGHPAHKSDEPSAEQIEELSAASRALSRARKA